MVKMYTVLVFVILKVCGLACYNNTKLNGILPKQNRYEMQVYSVSSEPSVEMYPVKKTSEYKTGCSLKSFLFCFLYGQAAELWL